MKRTFFALIALVVLSGCSRNGEYIYISQLKLLQPVGTLAPKLRERLRTSAFRKNYDQTLVDRIGSSFKNFKQIRAYQAVLEDALIYIMARTNTVHLEEDLRNALIPPVSKLILSDRPGDEFLLDLDKIVNMVDTKEGPTLIDALAAYDKQIKAENK